MAEEQLIRLIGYFHLIAGAQGLFLVAVLRAYPAENRIPNRSLSLFILAFSVIILGIGLGATGLYRSAPHLIRIGAPFLLLLGPSLLFYLTAMRIGRVPSVQRLHLIPFFLYTAALMPFYLSPADVKIHWVEISMTTGPGEAWLNLLMVTHLLGYLTWIWLLLRRHSRNVSSLKSDLAQTDLRWIRSLVSALLICSLLAFLLFSLSAAGIMQTLLANFLIGFVMAVIVYLLGYRSLVTPRIFGDRDYPSWESRSAWNLFWGELVFNPEAKTGDHYIREEYRLLERLRNYMESEKPYINPGLSLALLSSQTGIPQYLLSRIINVHLQQNFFDFVNEYRIKSVCERLVMPDQHRFTILSLAMDSGFNSKSSFNKAFLKSTGLTPSGFKKKHRPG